MNLTIYLKKILKNPCQCSNFIVKCRKPNLKNLFDNFLLDDVKELSVTNGNARNLNQTGFLNNDALHKRQKLQERIQNRDS